MVLLQTRLMAHFQICNLLPSTRRISGIMSPTFPFIVSTVLRGPRGMVNSQIATGYIFIVCFLVYMTFLLCSPIVFEKVIVQSRHRFASTFFLYQSLHKA